MRWLYSLFTMFDKHTTALYAIIISSIVIASVFAFGFVPQQASAQGNQTSGGSGNGNQSSSNSTSGGAAPGGSTTGTSSGSGY
jgi:uncharacterized membrane protein